MTGDNAISAHAHQMYCNGQWITPDGREQMDVINPATEQPCARITLGNARDTERAIRAARAAFPAWSMTDRATRLAALERIVEIYKRRMKDMARAISLEMGSPLTRAYDSQAWAGMAHLEEMMTVLRDFPFQERRDDMLIVHEAVGVTGLITPWNWPMNQIACKVAPALAAGCTIILKPSEVAPLSALLFTEILDEAGLPPGVYNMLNGTGPEVGEAMARSPLVDMVSITGSTRAGAAVARLAADTVKRVHQELGGKSPNIILPDADLEQAVAQGVRKCFSNSGQSCDAPTRMLVPAARMEEALDIARRTAATIRVGNPMDPEIDLGPVVSHLQFDRIQTLIQKGMDEGATLVCGGPGRPDGLACGYYVRPTIFGHVTSGMAIAQEEVFGPVLVIMAYDNEEHAIQIANDTPYGLAAYIQSGDLSHARHVARYLRAGNVNINGAPWTVAAPFGGYGQSGNGRECSVYGLRDFMEIKAILGYWTAS
ncbi:aldehyde dehydrogenase family protein [Komagataeibacter swingsii]|nr:aldehyde dehydrogenase family protein [Komagataeibacter swingsii]